MNPRFLIQLSLCTLIALPACATTPSAHPVVPPQAHDRNAGALPAAAAVDQPDTASTKDTTPLLAPSPTEGEASEDRPDEPPMAVGPFSWKGDVLVLGEGDLLLDVTLVREKTDTSWNEPFVAQTDAHVSVSIARNEHIADGPVNTIATWDIPATTVPTRVQWYGDQASILADGDEFLFFIDIHNHEGDEPRVGDLGSEYVNELAAGGKGATVKLTGLEHCDSPDSGGFCTSAR